MRIRTRVNGRAVEEDVEPRLLLSDFIRHRLGLTGTHVGGEHGVCGACTVALDGRAVRSCLMLAVQADGGSVETVESLCLENGDLGPLQQAFADHHSFQCAFCAPGFIMTAHCLLAEERGSLSRDEISEELSGNLCRCTGYQSIIDGMEAAVAALAKGASGA